MKRYIIELTSKRTKRVHACEAESVLEARTKALVALFGPGTYWDSDYVTRYGWAVTAIEKRRGKKTRYVDKKRSERLRVHVAEEGA